MQDETKPAETPILDAEILSEFLKESKGLLEELRQTVEVIEKAQGAFPEAALKEFAQKIDRIMGTVQTLAMSAPGHLGLAAIGKLAELCKSIGNRAAEKKSVALLPYFAAFWADTLEVIDELMDCLLDLERTRTLMAEYPPVLQGRLAWLKERIEKS